MSVYYNEIEPFAISWLQELMKAGEIPQGDIDTRSILEVKADDIRGYTQCHFFAGIGGWASALRLAGWSETLPVWTGSCPCQPFSTAGKGLGSADPRHLWPTWFNLIRQCRPSIIFGEQVAAAITHGWLDSIYDDMEEEGYACGAANLPACSIGAAHKRERIWFVAKSYSQREQRFSEYGKVAGFGCGSSMADATSKRFQERSSEQGREPSQKQRLERLCPVGDTEYNGLHTSPQPGRNGETYEWAQEGAFGTKQFTGASYPGVVADAENSGAIGHTESNRGKRPNNNSEVSLDWVNCPDGKARPVKPGICLLADGVPNRVGKLRGYGNAIVPGVAAEFITAAQGAISDSGIDLI